MEVLTRTTCEACGGNGCGACNKTGHVQSWIAVEKLAEQIADKATQLAYRDQF